jgi:serine/threonine protein phosphatase PrpC
MGIFQCCKSKKRSKGKKKDEDITRPRGVYSFSRDGDKRDQEMAGQDFHHEFGFEVEDSYVRLIGVYDGHGERGKEASNLVGNYIGNWLNKNKQNIKKWNNRDIVTKKFTDLYKSIQKLTSKNKEWYELSGTCAVSALLIDKSCYVINLGDSRAVIGSMNGEQKYAFQMSVDHKPNNFEEQERIVKMGGEVTNFKDGQYGPYRVYKNNGDNVPGLAIARSLGDLVAHECGVGEIPQISFKLIDSYDEFIVIGSDGIWDVMNSVEIVGYVFERLDSVGKERIAEEIVEECHKRWDLINKYKDEMLMERIMSDSSVPTQTKNIIQSSYNQQQQAANNPNFTGNVNTTVGKNFSQIRGFHNIDDITCVILFFKS